MNPAVPTYIPITGHFISNSLTATPSLKIMPSGEYPNQGCLFVTINPVSITSYLVDFL